MNLPSINQAHYHKVPRGFWETTSTFKPENEDAVVRLQGGPADHQPPGRGTRLHKALQAA